MGSFGKYWLNDKVCYFVNIYIDSYDLLIKKIYFNLASPTIQKVIL